MKYFVVYQVTGFAGIRESGPYDHYHQARAEARDIEIYEGVHSVAIVEREDPPAPPDPGPAWRPTDEEEALDPREAVTARIRKIAP